MSERADPKADELDRRKRERRKWTLSFDFTNIADLIKAIALAITAGFGVAKAVLEWLKKSC